MELNWFYCWKCQLDGREREGGWIDSTELGFLCFLITLVLEMLLEALWHVEWLLNFPFFIGLNNYFLFWKHFYRITRTKTHMKYNWFWAIEKDLLITIQTNHTNNKKLPNRTFEKGFLLTCVCSSLMDSIIIFKHKTRLQKTPNPWNG